MKASRAHPKNGAGRRRDAARTRDALIAAGTGLFAEHGYDGVPVATIAAKAKVNKAMINYHFGGKRNLYVAIVSATFSEIVSRVEALADSSRPAPDLLRDLVAIVGDTATRRSPHFCTMMLREVLSGESTSSSRCWPSRRGCSAPCSASWSAASARGRFARSIRC